MSFLYHWPISCSGSMGATLPAMFKILYEFLNVMSCACTEKPAVTDCKATDAPLWRVAQSPIGYGTWKKHVAARATAMMHSRCLWMCICAKMQTWPCECNCDSKNLNDVDVTGNPLDEKLSFAQSKRCSRSIFAHANVIFFRDSQSYGSK